MIKAIPVQLDTVQNTEVLQLLYGQSCHGDIILPIEKCLKDYNDVEFYCPDGRNFSYICWHVNNIIFAYATGMQKVSVKLAQTGLLDFSKLKTVESFEKCSNWYSVAYNTNKLQALVNNSYQSAKIS